MTVDEAIRGRRTLKEFAPEPVDAAVVRDLLALAAYAPNHHRTEPWRFVVCGRATLEALAAATGDRKLLRSHTAIAVAQAVDADPAVAREDYAACACAIHCVLVAAHARGLASYWRTPAALHHPEAVAILGLGDDEPVGLVHLGRPATGIPAPPARSAGARTRWLP